LGRAIGDPGAYDTIDYFVRHRAATHGAQIKLMLSGDLHHYARYEGPQRQLITCGGGGAYLYPTHKLPADIKVAPPASLSRKQSPTADYRLAARFPSKSRSRRYAAGVFGRLPSGATPASSPARPVAYVVALSIVEQMHKTGSVQRLVSIPVGIMGVILLPPASSRHAPTAGSRSARHWLFGAGHGIAHIGLGVLGGWAWSHLPFVGWRGRCRCSPRWSSTCRSPGWWHRTGLSLSAAGQHPAGQPERSCAPVDNRLQNASCGCTSPGTVR